MALSYENPVFSFITLKKKKKIKHFPRKVPSGIQKMGVIDPIHHIRKKTSTNAP
jgi:hypothetical protein